jgi:hypothetical protein
VRSAYFGVRTLSLHGIAAPCLPSAGFPYPHLAAAASKAAFSSRPLEPRPETLVLQNYMNCKNVIRKYSTVAKGMFVNLAKLHSRIKRENMIQSLAFPCLEIYIMH